MQTTIMEGITGFTSDLQFEDLPSEVVDNTKRILLDSIGCAIAGTVVDKGIYAIHISQQISGPPESTILGTGEKVSSLAASYMSFVWAPLDTTIVLLIGTIAG